MMKFARLTVLFVIPVLLFFSRADAEEGDFFFAPEFGWSHFFESAVKEGFFTGARFGYDTSDRLTIDLLFYYGDNNGVGGNPDLKYVLGGGGITYKYRYKFIKPSVFAGADITSLKFSGISKTYKGGLYFGGAVEFYLNKVISLGLCYQYTPLFKSKDISLLGFRLGFEL